MENNYSLYPVLRSDKPNKNGLCPLYIRYTYKRKWKNLPLKKTLEAKFWNADDNEPRKNCPNRVDILNLIRTQKTNIEGKILSYSREFGDYPSPDDLLDLVSNHRNTKKDWDYYYDIFVENQKENNNVENSSLQVYGQCKMKLASFLKDKNLVWSWNSIGLDFYNQFIYYLRTIKLRNGNIGHKDSAIGKHIKTLKTFFNFVSVRYDIINPNQYRNFKTLREEPDFVILNDEDIEIMKSAIGVSYILPNKIKLTSRESLIVRIMILLCKTGMNIGDLIDLKVTNIFKYEEIEKEVVIELTGEVIKYNSLYIKKNRQKLKKVTKKTIPVIPITVELALLIKLSFSTWEESLIEANKLYHKRPSRLPENYGVNSLSKLLDELKNANEIERKELLEFYPNLLGNISEPAFNKEIKEVLGKIGLDYEVAIYENTSKNKVKEVLGTKASLVSSRTGRRSYITGQIAKGVSPSVIMRAVGISKPDTLKRYDNLSDNTIVDHIKKANKNPQKIGEDDPEPEIDENDLTDW